MMVHKPDYVHKKFVSQKAKTLHNALAHRIAKEFPRMGGKRICDLCAEMVMEEVNQHMKPLERVHHGQLVWAAVSIDDPPRRHQRIADTDLVPVVLDLSNSADIDARVERKSANQRMLDKAIRLCRQAHEQGGLLSNCDLAEMLTSSESRISSLLARHEREQGQIVPRRATLHDVGSGMTHKRIICRMRYVEGKEPHLIGRLTHHSLQAVDRYLGLYDRVRHCKSQGLTPPETAHALACSVKLIQEYLDIDDELEVENGRK